MTSAQKLAIRLSEITTKINELNALDDLNEEQRNELDTVRVEYATKASQHRAALTLEGEEEARARGEFPAGGNGGDGEGAEVRALLGRVRLDHYLQCATRSGIDGAPRELNESLKLPIVGKFGGTPVPWDMLRTAETRARNAGAAEMRAFTTTAASDGSTIQRPILQELFAPGVLDITGCRVDSVPVGQSEWLVISGNISPAQKKEGTAAGAAATASFTTASLKPKRLTAETEYTHELGASVGDIENQLRINLMAAMKNKMSDIIVNGTAPTQQQPERIEGFLAELTDPTAPAAVATFADYGSLHAKGVDGIHAEMETQVSGLIGVESYVHAASVYQAGSGEAGSEALKRRSMMCVASAHIPDAASDIQQGILHAAGPNGGGIARGDSVAGVWPTLEVVLDRYSQASQGVKLTAIMLWDAKVALRPAAYKQISFQLA